MEFRRRIDSESSKMCPLGCYGRSRRNVKKHDYENDLAKTEFYTLNGKQNVGC